MFDGIKGDSGAFRVECEALYGAYLIANDSAARRAPADGLGRKWNRLAVPAILVYDSGGDPADAFVDGGLTDAMLEQVDRWPASGQENQP